MITGRTGLMALVAAAVLATGSSIAHAWSHQGHILITRMAALRIINDPAAPQGLKDFLKANMKYDLDACRKLATEEMVGENPKNYQVGLDGACTLPDRIQFTDDGKAEIAPYGAPEGKMHFMDMEWLGKTPAYKPDLSNRPKIADIPHDYKDPRWKQAGFVPFRVEEMYTKVVADFASQNPDNDQTLHDTGYLCHYIEDCHQPLHATIDYKCYSYLAGEVPAVHKITHQLSGGGESVDYMVDKKDSKAINPHGDIEFQLFENDKEPRKGFREEFWKELNLRIDHQAKSPRSDIAKAGSFVRALEILTDSYDYIPAIGKAAQAAYATGKFDPVPFFTSKDTVHGQQLDTVQLIAERNAAAVLEVERTLRAAWAQAHGEGAPKSN